MDIAKSLKAEILKVIETQLTTVCDQVAETYSETVDRVIETTEVFENDIVDTGRLLESKEEVVSGDLSTEKVYEFSWSPQNPEDGYYYAPAVWAGFFAYGKKYIPPRHWPEEAMKLVDPANQIADRLSDLGIEAEVTQNQVDQL